MSSRRFLRLTLVVALLLVGGCATINPFRSTQTTLLEEYRQVRSMTAAQTEGVVTEREQRYAQDPSDINRLRLALALGFGKGAVTDPKRALQLFGQSTKRDDALHSDEALFADVFGGILKERLQAEAKISTAEAKISGIEARANVLNRQLEGERERADELEKKLEALKSIEKSLRKR